MTQKGEIVTSVKMFLAGDDRACVFCGQLSEKGIVAEVEHNLFFACAYCLQYPLLTNSLAEITDTGRFITGEENRGHACVACGRAGIVGLHVQEGENAFFLCQQCAQDATSAIVLAWCEFGRKRHRERLQPPQGAATGADDRGGTGETRAREFRQMAVEFQEKLKEKDLLTPEIVALVAGANLREAVGDLQGAANSYAKIALAIKRDHGRRNKYWDFVGNDVFPAFL